MVALVSRGALGQVTCSSPGYTSPQIVTNNALRLNYLLGNWTSLRCNGTIVFANTGAPLTLRLKKEFILNSRLVLDGSARSHPLVLLTGGNARHFNLPTQPANLTAINIVFSDAFYTSVAQPGASINLAGGAHLRLIRCTFRNCRLVANVPTRSGGAIRGTDAGVVYLQGCTFLNNTIVNNGWASRGAAVGIQRASKVWLLRRKN
jgi:hypothetical protein